MVDAKVDELDTLKFVNIAVKEFKRVAKKFVLVLFVSVEFVEIKLVEFVVRKFEVVAFVVEEFITREFTEEVAFKVPVSML